MSSESLADRLVDVAWFATESEVSRKDARLATVALLRELADNECTWDDMRLEDLADEIEAR